MHTLSTARAAALAAAVAGLAGAAHADVFLKIPGVAGSATAAGFEQQIEIDGASMNISSYLDYGYDGQSQPRQVTSAGPAFITKSPDRATPKLMQAAVSASQLGTVEITFTAPGRSGGMAVESRWILEGARVNSYGSYPDAGRDNAMTENVEIAYERMRVQYFPVDAQGVRATRPEEVSWEAPEPASPFGPAAE
jgi:type VI protein secretion system component Hcp